MALFDVNTPDTQFYQTPEYAKGLEADKLRLLGYNPDGSKNTLGKIMGWVNPIGSLVGNKIAQNYAQRRNLDATAGNIQDGFASQMAKLDAIVGVGRVAAGDLTGIGQVAGAGSALIAGGGGPNYNNDGDIVRTKTLAEGGIVTNGSAPTMYPEGSKQEDATVIDDETGEPIAKMRKGEMVVSQQTTMNLDAMVEAYNNSPKRKRETIAKAIGELMVAEVAQHEQSEQEQSAQEPQMFYKGGIYGKKKMFAGGGILDDLTPQQRKLLESLPVTDPTADNGFRFYEQLPKPPTYDSTFGVPQLNPATPSISPIARMNTPNSLTGTTGGYNALSGVTPSSKKVDPNAALTIQANGFVDSREPVSLDANVLSGISSGVKALVSAAGASKRTPKYRPNEAFTNYMRNLINESQQGFSAAQSGAIQQSIDNNFVNESERVRQLTSNGGTAASALAGMSSASQNRNAAGLSKELQDAQLKMQKQAQLGSILSGQEAQNRLLYQQDIARLENQRGAYINALVQNLDQINQQYSPEGKLSDQYTEMLFKRAKEMMDSSSTSNNAAIFSLFS